MISATGARVIFFQLAKRKPIAIKRNTGMTDVRRLNPSTAAL